MAQEDITAGEDPDEYILSTIANQQRFWPGVRSEHSIEALGAVYGNLHDEEDDNIEEAGVEGREGREGVEGEEVRNPMEGEVAEAGIEAGVEEAGVVRNPIGGMGEGQEGQDEAADV
jgi:hypothetical protein